MRCVVSQETQVRWFISTNQRRRRSRRQTESKLDMKTPFRGTEKISDVEDFRRWAGAEGSVSSVLLCLCRVKTP
ncbi:hypothetical protein MHYP_G00092620 [Metynnis hypsauchen]